MRGKTMAGTRAETQGVSGSVSGSVTGGCQCGAVRYAVSGPLRGIIVCHCRMCRRLTGFAGAFTACAPEALAVTVGKGLRWYRSSPFARRGFCSRCGAQLFWVPGHGKHVSIAAGSLDEPTGLVVDSHLYADSRADWWPHDDLPPAREPAAPAG